MPALNALKAALTTDNLPAVLNRQDVNPPSILITLRGFDSWTLCGNAEAGVRLYVVFGDRNDESALAGLAPHLDDVLALMDTLNLPVEAIEADTVAPTEATAAYPAFRIDTHITV